MTDGGPFSGGFRQTIAKAPHGSIPSLKRRPRLSFLSRLPKDPMIGKRESATWGDMALSGLRAQRGAVEGPHFRRGATETALLIVKTPATSPGSAVRMGGGALRENPVSRKGGLPRLSKKFK